MTKLNKNTDKTVILGNDFSNDSPLIQTNRDMHFGVDLLICLAGDAYARFSGIELKEDTDISQMKDSEVYKEKTFWNFLNGCDSKHGSKYIKITTGGSVWGFIVNTKNDKKFKYGDILKSASYNRAERNFARGNIIEDTVEELRTNTVCWTGVKY